MLSPFVCVYVCHMAISRLLITLGYYKSYVIHLSSSKAQSKTYTTKASENTIDLHMF